MIQFSNVCRSYNLKLAVSQLSFSVKPGKVTGLLGPNGAGKTTTLRLLLGILPPDSGQITINGKPFDSSVRDIVGYVPEERGFYKREKIISVFKYLSGLRGGDSKENEKRFFDVLEKFDLLHIAGKTGNELSKGQAQIVQLAVSLAHNPSIVVLDEPYSGLDPHNQEILLQIVQGLRSEGKYVLISTHLLEKADTHLDDIVLLNKGSIVYTGELKEFMDEKIIRLSIEFSEEPAEYPELPGLVYLSKKGTSCEITVGQEIELSQLFQQFSSSLPVTGVIRRQITLKEKFLELTNSQWEA